jgi:hypothetical protein
VNLSSISGLAIMIASEGATLAGIEPFASWNTPICWTGFILFADAAVYRARGNSWIRSAPREFTVLALASIPLWLIFEGYNLVIRNWNYTGLPENDALRMFGYAWSFATIWPAIFEGAELVAVARAGETGWAGQAGKSTHAEAGDIARPAPPALPARRSAALTIALGAAMLIAPFLVSPSVARYMAAPIWLGFIFLLDPINARLGAETLMPAGGWNRVINLSMSGLLCGVLWEFWNYWSRTKWHYTVPIMEHVKIFEMPLPGYLGFPAFALECFTMYVFVRRMVTHLGRTIAL